MVQLRQIREASGQRLFSDGKIPRHSSFRLGAVDDEPPLGYLGNNHPEDPLPPDDFLRGCWPWRRHELSREQLERYGAAVRRDVKSLSARGIIAPQHEFVRQVHFQFQVPPLIVFDRFSCGSVLEADFISVLDWYATHGKGREGDLAIAKFVLAVSFSSGRWDYTDLN